MKRCSSELHCVPFTFHSKWKAPSPNLNGVHSGRQVPPVASDSIYTASSQRSNPKAASSQQHPLAVGKGEKKHCLMSPCLTMGSKSCTPELRMEQPSTPQMLNSLNRQGPCRAQAWICLKPRKGQHREYSHNHFHTHRQVTTVGKDQTWTQPCIL